MSIETTILVALLSAVFRAVSGVIDRFSLGIKGGQLGIVNLANNALPAITLLPIAIFFCAGSHGLAHFADIRTIVFAAVVQGSAFAFSYAYRHYTVADVNLAAKIGDGAIPFALMAMGVRVTAVDITFALAVSAIIVALAGWSHAKRTHYLLTGAVITVAIIAQSVCGEYAFKNITKSTQDVVGYCLAFLVWRSIFSVPIIAIEACQFPDGTLATLKSLTERRRVLVLRTVATVTSQFTFIYVLAEGVRVVAWPLLNTVPIFAMLFSAMSLHEPPTRKQVVVTVGLVALVFGRALAA